jgi:hypothetical protein
MGEWSDPSVSSDSGALNDRRGWRTPCFVGAPMPRLRFILLISLAGCTFDPGGLTDSTTPPVGGGGAGAHLGISPAAHDFGAVVAGKASAPFTFLVLNTGTQASGPISVASDGAAFQSSSDCGPLAPGQTCQLNVIFAPPLGGPSTANVSLTAQPGGVVSAAVSGNGLAANGLLLSPPTWDFGAVDRGMPSGEQSFFVQNAGTQSVPSLPAAMLGGARPSAFAITYDGCQGKPLAPGATCLVKARFQPDRGGPSTATLSVDAAGSALTGTGKGYAWTEESSGVSSDLTSVWGQGGTVWVVGAGGRVLRSTGDGHWLPETSPTQAQLWCVTGAGSVRYAFGDVTVLRASGTGTFTVEPTPAATPALFGGFATNGDAFAVGDNGALLHGTPGGWQPEASGTSTTLNGAWGPSKSDLYLVGRSGTLVHLTNGTPTDELSTTFASLRGIWGASSTALFVVGRSGTILHGDGHGHWSAPFQLPPTLNDLSSVWGTSPSDVYAVGDNGALLHYDGTTWSALPVPTSASLLSIWGTSPTNLYAVGAAGTILHYQ